MNTTWKNSRRFAIMAVTCLSTFAAVNTVSAAEPGAKWLPWLEFGGYYNTEDASRGEVAIFLPVSQSSTDLLFIDARGKIFEGNAKEGNFALGYRHMHGSGFNFGAWVGADTRHSDQGNGFWQLSGGFEALSHNIDLRINWYGPATEERAAGNADFTKVHISGNNIFMTGGQEVALQGIDGEIGVRVPLELVNLGSPDLTLRAYAGGFYFDDDLALEEVAGVKTRLELRVENIIPSLTGSRLTAEYEFSYDDVRDDRHEVGARLRIPTSDDESAMVLASLTLQERRMIDGLERDTDIVTIQSKAEKVEDALTGVDFDRVAQVTGGGSITTTSNAAGANSLLIVNGTITGGQTVQPNQTVQGGGSIIQVRGLRSGTGAGFQASGSRPTVTTGAGDILTLLGNNTHIAGLRIDGQGTSGDGIEGGNGNSNIVIAQNAIQNTGNDGINFNNNNSNVHILGNTITMTSANEGIDFGSDNSGVTIDGNTITNPNSDGILFNNRNTNIIVTNNILSGGGDQAIEFDDDNRGLTISGNTISNFGEGINIDDNNSNIVVANNTIAVTDEGIMFDNGNTGLSITGNTIVSATDVAIEIDNDNSGVINNNTLTALVGDGINLSDRNTFTIADNTFNTIGDDAIRIRATNTVVIANNIFNGPIGGQLLDVDGVGNVLSGAGNTSNAGTACQSGTFTGTVTVSGVILQDGVTC